MSSIPCIHQARHHTVPLLQISRKTKAAMGIKLTAFVKTLGKATVFKLLVKDMTGQKGEGHHAKAKTPSHWLPSPSLESHCPRAATSHGRFFNALSELQLPSYMQQSDKLNPQGEIGKLIASPTSFFSPFLKIKINRKQKKISSTRLIFQL